MQAKSISEIQWGPMRHIYGHAGIKERARRLIADIATEISDPEVKRYCLAELIMAGDDGCLGTIATPVGNGRLLMRWGVDNDDLIGLIVLQRSDVNEMDQLVWQAVWALSVPEHGPIYTGGGDSRVAVLPDHVFGNDYSNAMFSIAMCMIYAIVSGPQFN